MGSWTTGAEIEAALNDIPSGTVLLLDEAYVEFAPADAVPSIDIEDPRVIRMRTFSKAYGMAGARVGYAFGATELITSFEKIRNHFGMNRAAQMAAIAALQDVDWLRKTIADVETSRQAISQIAADNGLVALPSATNFVTIDCGRDGDYARRVLGSLVAQGVFVRMPFVTPQDRCIRISAGREQDLEFVAAALPKALAEA
jgi:histidinol-phosphate aminotransferase